jgi:TorA maturation chaperone TorD
MALPKYLLADNSNFPEDHFVIHLEFPRFLLNLKDDSIEWLEDFSVEDQEEVTKQIAELIDDATRFFDEEMAKYD